MSVDGVDNSLISATLKAARESLKLSIADVSSQLHLSENRSGRWNKMILNHSVAQC